MSLWDDLKKKALGAVAQVNPFDGGKTYDTVVNNKPVTSTPAQVKTAIQPVSSPIKSPAVSVPAPIKNTSTSSFNVPGVIKVPQASPITNNTPKTLELKKAEIKQGPVQNKIQSAVQQTQQPSAVPLVKTTSQQPPLKVQSAASNQSVRVAPSNPVKAPTVQTAQQINPVPTIPVVGRGVNTAPANSLQERIQIANTARQKALVDENAKNKSAIDDILSKSDGTSIGFLGGRSLRNYKDQYNQLSPLQQREEKKRLSDQATIQLNRDNYDQKQSRDQARAALAVLGAYGNDGYDAQTLGDDIVKFIPNMIQGTVDTYGRLTGANARVLDELTTGSTRELNESRQATIRQLNDARNQIQNNDIQFRTTGVMSPDAEQKYSFFSEALQKEQNIYDDALAADFDIADPTKYAGAGAAVLLDAITAGAASNIPRIAKGADNVGDTANIAQKILNPQTIAQGIGSGAALGTGYGVAGSLEANGGEVTAQDILTGAVQGLAGGAVLGGLSGVISRGGVKTWDALNEATPEFLNTMRMAMSDQRGSLNLGEIGDSFNRFATRNNPVVLSLREHLNLLRQADEQMSAQGLSDNYAGRLNNKKAQEAVLAEINSVSKKLAQGGYIKIPGSEGDASPISSAKSRQSELIEGQRELLPVSDREVVSSNLEQQLQSELVPQKKEIEQSFGSRRDPESPFSYSPEQVLSSKPQEPQAEQQLPKSLSSRKSVLPLNRSLADGNKNAQPGSYAESIKGDIEKKMAKIAADSDEILKKTDAVYSKASGRADELRAAIETDRKNGIPESVIKGKQDMADRIEKGLQVKRLSRAAEEYRRMPDEPTSVKDVIDEKKRGEKFAKPRASMEMTQGKPNEEKMGVILSETKNGNQRRRLLRNSKTGVAEVLLESKNPDGTWSKSKEVEPAITSRDDFGSIDKIMTKVEGDASLNDAALKAIDDGKEIHFYAAKQTGDPSSLSAEIVPFNTEKMIIDGGFVRDGRTGQILGNHIKVDESGIQINIGKNVINMESVVGDPAKWRNMNRMTYTMDRLLEAAAPNKETYKKTRAFVVEHKEKAEGNMRVDLSKFRKEIDDWKKDLMSARPSTTRKKDFMTDVFHYSERKLSQPSDIKGVKLDQNGILDAKYGDKVAEKIRSFDKWARGQYDNLLDRTNEVLREFGHDEVQKRQNYMTHLQEDSFWDQIGIGEDLYRDLSAGIQGEVNMTNRGQLPGTIAGRTENFQPTKKYNPFHQTRRGNDSMTDPFKAMDAYGEAALFNIHMTESAVRARSLEAIFRTAEEVVNRDMLQQVSKELRESLTKAHGGKRGDLVVGFQEYANALAGKSNPFDRILQDKGGKTGRIALGLSRKLQKIASNASIVGNFNSTLSQTLNLPNVIGTNGGLNTVKGVSRLINDFDMSGKPTPGSPAFQSDFLKVRYTDAQSRINRSGLQIINRGMTKALLMEQLERAMVEMTWSSSYEKALKDKFKGKYAVKEADRMTERLVAGRGIGDQPAIYRSTIGRTFLQYTLEVNAALKNIQKDMKPAGVIKYALAVFVMNHLFEQLTGRAPLPDFLGATIETGADFADTESYSDENIGDKLIKGGQRFSAAAANLSPVVSSGVNTFLSQDAKEAIFGEESNFGRYDGTPAAAGVVSKLLQGGVDLLTGNVPGAWDKSLSAIPFGGQIRKTGQGIEAMMDGYMKDSKGNAATPIDTGNPINWAKAALFGKNAIPEVKAYYENTSSGLGNLQSETFKKLEKEQGKDVAIDYLGAVQQRREESKNDKKVGSQDDADFEAEKKVKIAEGDWVEKDGVVTYEDSGEIVKSYYKKKAKKAIEDGDQSDAAYDAILKGNGIKTLGSGKINKTGDDSLDKLNQLSNIADQKDVINEAVSLIKNSGDENGVPDWATKRYLKDNNIDEAQAVYATKASYDNDSKGAVIRDDIKDMAHDEVLGYLNNGRIDSIAGSMWVTQGVLAELRDEGVISKEEYTSLNKTSYNSDGSEKASKSSGSAKKVTAADLGALTAGGDIASKVAQIIAAASKRRSPGNINYKKRA